MHYNVTNERVADILFRNIFHGYLIASRPYESPKVPTSREVAVAVVELEGSMSGLYERSTFRLAIEEVLEQAGGPRAYQAQYPMLIASQKKG